MNVSTEQSYTVKFCMTLKKWKVKTIALMKENFQNETLHDSTIRRWHRAFTDGRESAEIEHVGGRPKTVVMDRRGLSFIHLFIHLKPGWWPTHPKNVNSVHFNKGALNEACLFNVGSSFPPGWRNRVLSFIVQCVWKICRESPKIQTFSFTCHHCWQILDSPLWS